MYFLYTSDPHLPALLMSASGIPAIAMSDAFPTLNECVLYGSGMYPSRSRHNLRVLATILREIGFPLGYMNRGPGFCGRNFRFVSKADDTGSSFVEQMA